MSSDGLQGGVQGIEGTSTFCNKDGNVMLKCESVTNSYPKYVHFINPFDSRNGSRKGKMLYPSRKVNNNFL